MAPRAIREHADTCPSSTLRRCARPEESHTDPGLRPFGPCPHTGPTRRGVHSVVDPFASIGWRRLQEDVTILKADVTILKVDVSGLKADVSGLKDDMRELRSDVKELRRDLLRVTGAQFITHRRVAAVLGLG
jgi:hypothetical protein